VVTKVEEWRDVVGYEGFYEVSNLGGVRRVIVGNSRRPLKPFMGTQYLFVSLSKYGKIVQHSVHRIVAGAFIGPCPIGEQVNHKDTNKLNNVNTNLEYVTSRENTIHAGKMGLLGKAKGESHGRAKLSEKQVIELKQRVRDGYSLTVVALAYNITPTHVCDIMSGKRWKHIK
jgi:hypothetical protein